MRYHGQFAYVAGELTGGEQLPLMRLRYSGSAHRWAIAIYKASNNSYEDQHWFSGTTEEALDPITECPHPSPQPSTPKDLRTGAFRVRHAEGADLS